MEEESEELREVPIARAREDRARPGDGADGPVEGNSARLPPRKNCPILLYNLAADIGEKRNSAHEDPAIVRRMAEIMVRGHSDSAIWHFDKSPQTGGWVP